ncbi:MAG: hypothetical protein ORN26_02060, partial [Candidatus Pacebacteria bacterium]|nr:hypothetical protein [Candidatus Paceibacterota bacterium]
MKGYIDSSSMLKINPQLQKGKQTATQVGSDKISLDENVKTIRRSINICFKEMAKFYAEIMSYT